MTESPILRAPTGELIDGRRLLAESVGFGRALRAAGLPIDLAAAIDFARALELDGVDLGSKDVVRDTGAALRTALDGGEHKVDMGWLHITNDHGNETDHPFLVFAGMGIDADMVAGADAKMKSSGVRLSGALSIRCCASRS